MPRAVHTANQSLDTYCLVCFISVGEDFIFGNSRDTIQPYASIIRDLPVLVNVEILPDLIPGEEDSFVLELADVALTNFSSGEKLDVIVAVNSVTVVIVDDDGRCCKYTIFLCLDLPFLFGTSSA